MLLRMAIGACWVGVLLAAIPSAARAAPVTLGTGSQPRVAVDADGNGLITWIESAPSADTFHYCKLPVGATRCAARLDFTDANQDVDGGYAFVVGGNRVLLLEARGVSPNRAKYLWSSTDGGVTFGDPTRVGSLAGNGGGIAGAALFAPTGTLGLGEEAVFTLGAGAGVSAPFQATGTTEGMTSSSAELAPNVAASLGLKDTTLLAALSDFHQLSWSRYTGTVPATIEGLNTAGNWSSPAPVGPRSAANTETAVASGPGGIFVGYEVDAAAGQADFVASQFTGSDWTSPTVIARDAVHPDLYQDAGGHLRAVWKDASGFRYRFSSSAGLSAPQTLDATAGESYAFPRVASNSSGIGWAVYAGAPGVQAVPLASTSTTSTYTGPTKVVTGVGFGATYTLTVPKGCLAPGQRFRVTLRWKRQRRKGNLFVKVSRTDFYLGSKRLTIDRRAPFVHTYRVLVTQRSGSTITVRARAFIKVKRGRSPKKSIRVKVNVCP